ncbi:PLP-dependent aminotransferase family protein [Asanoa sp. WMMD1127]|uniref:MocR-like pyridoxine biosynthesis transcription factor PdxR n=1 Tax=Asanoa sp. WMMD1127 TaxID=3016107 RepID=UPI0024172D8B|nr:PLP-dependent aminotransferase family protein [Asanoa sp. WMMD1127]MDG4820694.1 PLP-dependent aminotransferase family protein [Asanoa sp. WMMD1127]
MAESWTNSSTAADLLVAVDRTAAVALHRQIESAIRDGIRTGRLPLGASLPPTRTLATDLGVSRGIVVEAYQQLVAEGYLSSRPGGYTRVAAGPAAPRSAPPVESSPPVRIDFGYGRADVAHFPRAAWLRSLRRVLTVAPNDRFGYSSGRGVPELLLALPDYLNRVRGAAATPATTVVTNGFAQGIALVIQVLAARGARRIAVEDPSPDDDARAHAHAAGLEVVGVPVGADGVDVTALAAASADALVVTPSHQWPTGGVLPAAARAAVLGWAHANDAVVVEDDYDAEYRYDRAPVGALQGLGPERVIYAGTTSKTLAPGLRLGWLVAPPALVDDLAAAKQAADRGSSALDQLAFADFLAHGEFDRHLRRMRPVYRRRRDALLAALAAHLPEFRPAGVAAGLHLVAWLPPGLDEDTVVAAGLRSGVGVHGVGPYRLAPGPPGLIFGYATLDPPAIDEGLGLLAAAL